METGDVADTTGDEQRTGRRRYRRHAIGAALVSILAVCLPWLVTRDVVAEWSGAVLLLRTFLVVILVLISGAVLLATGRAHPLAAALGRGAVAGGVLGLYVWFALNLAFPAPPPPDPLQPGPATTTSQVPQTQPHGIRPRI